MLDAINSNDDLKSKIGNQALEAEAITNKYATNPIKNPYGQYFVDESNISNEALNMLDKDKTISKFTKLALSEPLNGDEDKIVAKQIAEGKIEFDDDEFFSSLINNEKFLNDLNG